MLLATLQPDANGITDCHANGTYAGGIVPFARPGPGLALAEVLNNHDAPYNRATYERALILITGGFAD